MSIAMIRKRDILEGVRINGKVVSLLQVGNGADASKPDTAKLARLISAYARTTAVSICASLICTPVAFHE